MRIAIERHKPGIVGDFLDGLAATAQKLGNSVSRDVRHECGRPEVVCVVWNGRDHQAAGPTLYCEHAWLPRWEYQISPGGINADSHLAPFRWDGEPLSDARDAALERHLESIRRGGPKSFKYMQTAVAGTADVPEAFLLVPLQMEWDTNIRRHVPDRYRHMQTLVDDVSRSNPPFPIVFKQHPADVRRGRRQLRLRLSRSRDSLWPHERGNVHQLLKSGHCRGVVSLNSNVVHDGMLWDVPAVVLGKNIWPRSGTGPFLTVLPEDWSELAALLSDPSSVACRRAYAHYLMRHQWKLADTRDVEKVAALFTDLPAVQAPPARQLVRPPADVPTVAAARRRSRRDRQGLLVNVAALNRGWFFEDVKRHFLAAHRPGVQVVVSDRPRNDADRWIVLRTQEAGDTPDPTRTVVQIHDMFDNGLYGHGQRRACVARCRGVSLTHPEQRQILAKSGIDLSDKIVLERPIGALEAFTPRDSLAPRFTVAWVGRPVRHFNRELKRVDCVVEALLALGGELRVVLLGERLEAQRQKLRRAGVDCEYHHRSRNPIEKYPGRYKDFDCVLVYSLSEAGPLCLFEALASGVPVISSAVGWAPQLIEDGRNGQIVHSVEQMVEAMKQMRRERRRWFERRAEIRRSLQGYTLESWVVENLDMATGLAVQKAA